MTHLQSTNAVHTACGCPRLIADMALEYKQFMPHLAPDQSGNCPDNISPDPRFFAAVPMGGSSSRVGD